MSKDINIVLSGSFEGCKIEGSSNSKYARIKNTSYYFVKDKVTSISMVNQMRKTSLTSAAVGTAVFGTGGAALGNNKQEIILEVNWKHGGKSLIKVNPSMYEKIVSGMFKDVINENLDELKAKDNKSNENDQILIGILIIICIFSLLMQ